MAFATAFIVINAIVLVFVGLVLHEARRRDGGAHWSGEFVLRLGRLPSERSEANRIAFYVHRVSGIGIFAFLVLHIADVSLFAISPPLYADVHALYGSPIMRIFECALLFGLLFHALNGLRLIAIDVWDLGTRAAVRLLSVVFLVSAAAGAAGSIVILAPVIS
jgi:succinate dehydrogenase / fumarate reductase cytochrome b subunit